MVALSLVPLPGGWWGAADVAGVVRFSAPCACSLLSRWPELCSVVATVAAIQSSRSASAAWSAARWGARPAAVLSAVSAALAP